MDQLKGSGKLPSAQQGSGKDHVNAKMCELRESLKRSTDTFISEFKEELRLLLDSWQSSARRVDDPQKFVSPPSSTPELISATTGSLISVNDGSQVDMSLKFGSLQPSSVNLVAAIADDSVVRNSIYTGLNLLQHEVRFNTGISTDPVASDISNSHDISDETVGLMNDISAVVSKSSCEDDISVGMTEELNHVSNSRRVSIGNREFGTQSTEGVISGDGTEFDDSKVVISGAHLAPVKKGIEKTVQALVDELEINSRSVKDYNDVEAVKTMVARNGKQIGKMSVIAPLSGSLVAESRVAAHMSIRDKGGGLAQQLIEFTSGVNSEEEVEGSTVQLCVREYTKKVEELSRPLRTPGNAYTEVYSSNNLEFRTVKSQYCWDELCLMSGNCGITCNNDCVAVLEGLEYKSCNGDHEKAAKYAPSCHQECGEFQLKFESLNEVSRCCTYETSLKVIQLVPIIKKAPHVIIERHKVPFDVGDKYELECLICCCLLLCDCKEEVSTHVGLLKLDGYIFCLPLEDKFENVSLFIADKLEKTGEKRLLKNAATLMFVSKDTLYVALGTVNGDICVVEMKQMEHELAAGIKKKELYVNSEIVPEKIWENWKLKSYAEMASEEKISLFLDEKYDKMEGSAGMMYNYIWEKWKSVVMAVYKYHTKGLHVGDHIIEMSKTGGNIHVPKFDSFASHFGITTFFASALQQYGPEIRVESLSAYFPSNRYDTSTSIITVAQAVSSVLCWKCGILMAPNAAGRCFKCLQCEVDFAKGLQKQVTIMHCLECDIYLQPRRTWIKTPIESNELLAFCVKRLKNLNKFSNTGDIFRPVVKNQISILGVKEWMITSGSSRDDKLACKWLLEFLVSGMIFLLCRLIDWQRCEGYHMLLKVAALKLYLSLCQLLDLNMLVLVSVSHT